MTQLNDAAIAALARYIYEAELQKAKRENRAYFKINAIKELRAITGFSLLLTKNLIEACAPRDPVDPVLAVLAAHRLAATDLGPGWRG